MTLAEAHSAGTSRLRIRSLVVSRDLDFRDRALRVLARLGPVAFAVARLDGPADVVELVRQERADVVVLDATASAPAAARATMALHGLAPRVGVVVVCDPVDAAPRSLRPVPKWGPPEELAVAVQHAYRQGGPLRTADPAYR